MMPVHDLKGRRIAVLAADGFEKVELTVPVKALRLAGAKVDIVSLWKGRIRGVNLHEPASRVHVDRTVADADPADYDGLLVPGGFINPDLLRQSVEAREFVRAFMFEGKPVATLCHGPWVFASAGVLEGRTLTSWPGIRDDVVNAGATWLDQDVVRDGNLVTSRGPQDLAAFTKAIAELFSGAAAPSTAAADGPASQKTAASSLSAPQADKPPAPVLRAMRWAPRPSVRTALVGMGAIAAALAPDRRRKRSGRRKR